MINYDAFLSRPDGYEPTYLLDCPACHAHIPFYLADDNVRVSEHIMTLGEYDFIGCECGATFAAGDDLEIIEA